MICLLGSPALTCVSYKPGDIAVIRPVASASEVDEILEILHWTEDADKSFTIERVVEGQYLFVTSSFLYLCSVPDQSFPENLPTKTTLRQLFTHHVDFNAVPRRSFFQWLRHFVSDDHEVEKLDEFLSPEGAVGSL